MIPHAEMPTSRAEPVRFALSVPPNKETIYTSIMSEALLPLHHDSEIGLYQVRQERPIVTSSDKKISSNEQIIWSLSVTTPNDLLVKSVLWGHLMVRIAGHSLSPEVRSAIMDIMEQMKPCIRQSRHQPIPLHPTHIKA